MQENQETEQQERERLRKEYQEKQAAELKQRKQLGEQGRLRSIEVRYIDRDGVKFRFLYTNRTGAEVMEFRERVFAAGLMIPIDPGRWIIIPPCDIISIEIQKQSKFFD